MEMITNCVFYNTFLQGDSAAYQKPICRFPKAKNYSFHLCLTEKRCDASRNLKQNPIISEIRT